MNKITVAYGDGIGPEIMEATLKILQAAKVSISIDTIDIGEKQYARGFSSGIPDSCWETIKNNKIILKAPITTPQGKGHKSLNVTLRKSLGLYANLRPVISYHPFVKNNFPNINLVIVRENEEDLYAGIEYRLTSQTYETLKLISRKGSRKISQFAFDYAIKNNRKKVTCFVKDNIMKFTDGAFHEEFDNISEYYPEIEADQMIIDIATAKVAADPERFDVIVTSNLYGDIVSDVAAEVAGSVGMCGSANIGDEFAMFEAIHGSAPDIAGQNIANPSGLINAAIMLLRHLEDFEKAALIQNALHYTIEQGSHTADLYNKELSKEKLGTQEFALRIIENLGKTPISLPKAKEYSTNIVNKKNIKTDFKEAKKELVGIDVFIDSHSITNNDSIDSINEASKPLLLNLQQVSYKGLSIWPENKFNTKKADYLRCRFVAQGENKVIDFSAIIELLEILHKNDIDIIKSENLFLFDGKLGFSQMH